MSVNVDFDLTPIMIQFFKIRTELSLLTDTLLDEEQLKEFDAKYSDRMKSIISEFLENNPGIVSDEEELRKNLDI